MAKKNAELVVMNADVENRVYTDDGVLEKLHSKELAKDITSYIKREKGIEEGLWGMTKLITRIMTRESYKKDFATDSEFAAFMGMSKGSMSKMKRVGSLVVGTANLQQLGFSVSQAEEMLSAADKETGSLDELFEVEHIDPKMTRDDIRASVKAYKDACARIAEDDAKNRQKGDTGNGSDDTGDGVDNAGNGLNDLSDEENDSYIYTLPVFVEDAVDEWTVNITSYDALERIAKAIKKVLDTEDKKGTLEDLT